MLRSQIMSRAEYILGNKIFHNKFTKKQTIFFMECKLLIISTCKTRNLSMLYDSLGPSDIFVMKLALFPQISCPIFFLILLL